MKFRSCLVLAALSAAACSNPAHPTATLNAPVVAANSVADGHNCQPPAWNSVTFDKTNPVVTVLNSSPCTNDFVYAIWKINGSDDLHQQTLEAWVTKTLAPGATAQFALDIPEECSLYQADLYFGVKSVNVDVLNNFLVQWSAGAGATTVFYTSGRTFVGTCGKPTPPVIPPPPGPPGPTGPTGPTGCTVNCEPPPPPPGCEVDCGPVPPPPPPTTVGFCHIEYNTHTEGRDHHEVVTFIHEQNLNITQQAITNGHSDPAHHSYDHLGACTGQYAPIVGPQ